MTTESNTLAAAELVDRAEVMGDAHGTRRFWATQRGLACSIRVPPEFLGKPAAVRAYLSAETAGYLAAVEAFELAKQRAQNARS